MQHAGLRYRDDGYERTESVVVVVCIEDFDTGERRAYEFGRVQLLLTIGVFL